MLSLRAAPGPLPYLTETTVDQVAGAPTHACSGRLLPVRDVPLTK
jgi:hypothetical protein